jgi:hypothetical protein
MLSKDNDIRWNLALALLLFAIGLVTGTLFETKVHTIMHANYELQQINMQNINYLEGLRGCTPTNSNS